MNPTTNEDDRVPKSRKGKKAFVLERRYIGPVPKAMDFMREFRTWHKYQAYRTERDRLQAMENLSQKSEPDYWKWEYRVQEQ